MRPCINLRKCGIHPVNHLIEFTFFVLVQRAQRKARPTGRQAATRCTIFHCLDKLSALFQNLHQGQHGCHDATPLGKIPFDNTGLP